LAELVAHLGQTPDFAESKTTVKGDRGVVVCVDRCDENVDAVGACSIDQRAQQRCSDSGTPMGLGHMDRVLRRVPIALPLSCASEVSVRTEPHDASVIVGDEYREAVCLLTIEPRSAFVDRLKPFGPRRRGRRDQGVVQAGDRFQIIGRCVANAHDLRLHVRIFGIIIGGVANLDTGTE
jgi:hypothetical protein